MWLLRAVIIFQKAAATQMQNFLHWKNLYFCLPSKFGRNNWKKKTCIVRHSFLDPPSPQIFRPSYGPTWYSSILWFIGRCHGTRAKCVTTVRLECRFCYNPDSEFLRFWGFLMVDKTQSMISFPQKWEHKLSLDQLYGQFEFYLPLIYLIGEYRLVWSSLLYLCW